MTSNRQCSIGGVRDTNGRSTESISLSSELSGTGLSCTQGAVIEIGGSTTALEGECGNHGKHPQPPISTTSVPANMPYKVIETEDAADRPKTWPMSPRSYAI